MPCCRPAGYAPGSCPGNQLLSILQLWICRRRGQTRLLQSASYSVAAPEDEVIGARVDMCLLPQSARCAVLLAVLAAASLAQQPATVSAPSEEATQRANESLPQSPGATLREQMERGVMAQPPCRGEVNPCVLTDRQKFHMFVKRSYSPYTFASAAFDAAYSQFTHEDYGRGIAGFGQRYGANLADGESRSFFQTFLYSSLFHQDPRYHRIDQGNFVYRASYAATRVLVGRKDSGESAINFPELLGVATSGALTNAYYPYRDQGVGRTVNRGIGDLLSDAGSNLLREFWPDMRRMLRRHEPRAVQRLENRMTAVNLPGHRKKDAEAAQATGASNGAPRQ